MLTRIIVDEGLYGKNISIVIHYAIISFLLYLVSFIIGLVKEQIRINIKNTFHRNLWKQVIKKINQVKINIICEKNPVEFVQCMENDISMISGIFDDSAMFAVTEVLGIIGGIIGLFIVSSKMAVLVLMFIPIKLIEVYIMSKRNMNIMKVFIKSMQEFSIWIGQYISGIKDIRLWGLYDRLKNEFEKKIDNELEASKKRSILTYVNMNIDHLLIELVVIGIYIIGAIFVEEENITIGAIIVFITYCTYILAPLSSVLNIFFVLSGIKPSMKRVDNFLQKEEERTEKQEEVDTITSITMEQVSFAYGEEQILKGVDFHIKKGEKVVIFGKNGCGKTTFMNILLRLEKENEGKVKVNNEKIDEFDINSYRKKLAVVSTDFYLFHDTIRNNICIDKEIKIKELDEIIEVCGLHELIEKKGLDYVIGDNGEHLSAGQRQKICIARAMASKRDLIFMDEPTSNMDIESKQRLMKKIIEMEQGILMISHDKEVLEDSDKIFYMKNGMVVDQGNFEELSSRNENFAKEIVTI